MALKVGGSLKSLEWISAAHYMPIFQIVYSITLKYESQPHGDAGGKVGTSPMSMDWSFVPIPWMSVQNVMAIHPIDITVCTKMVEW